MSRLRLTLGVLILGGVALWWIVVGSMGGVDFYGKVEDQNGKPVEGVELKGRASRGSFFSYFRTGSSLVQDRFSVRTDANGLFAIEARKGRSLEIERILKDGYIAPQSTRVFFHSKSGEQSEIYYWPERSKPLVYQLWKKGETEPLIKQGVRLKVDPAEGISEVYYPFVLDGEPSPVPVPEWDIKVTGNNSPSQDKRRPQDSHWEVTITAREGGGLRLTDSPHANLAPESGYEQSLTFRSSDQPNRRGRPRWRGYYRGVNGEKYASFWMVLGLGTRKTGDWFTVELGMRVNPNASRNLEYDSSKRIR